MQVHKKTDFSVPKQHNTKNSYRKRGKRKIEDLEEWKITTRIHKGTYLHPEFPPKGQQY